MIKHALVLTPLASLLLTAPALADDKPDITVSNVKFSPRKAEDGKRKPFLLDLSATVKLTHKVEDPKLAYVGMSAFCYTGTALSNDSALPDTMTPLTDMTVGKTQEIKAVGFTTWGLEKAPQTCSIRVFQGEAKAWGGKTVAEFCWRSGKVKADSVKNCTPH